MQLFKRQHKDAADASDQNHRWIAEEEQRQLQEVKERLERVEDQLLRIRRQQGDV